MKAQIVDGSTKVQGPQLIIKDVIFSGEEVRHTGCNLYWIPSNFSQERLRIILMKTLLNVLIVVILHDNDCRIMYIVFYLHVTPYLRKSKYLLFATTENWIFMLLYNGRFRYRFHCKSFPVCFLWNSCAKAMNHFIRIIQTATNKYFIKKAGGHLCNLQFVIM